MKKYKVYTKEKGLIETNDYNDFLKLTWHREDGPAVICYYENGSVEYEEYWVNGSRYRLNGPAAIKYYDSGNIKYKEYWVNGNLHRLDGPAVIQYAEDGNIIYEAYCINDIWYTKEDYHKELLKLKINLLNEH